MFFNDRINDKKWALKYFASGLKSAVSSFLPSNYYSKKEKFDYAKNAFAQSVSTNIRNFFESQIHAVEEEMAGLELCYIFYKTQQVYSNIPESKIYFGCTDDEYLELWTVLNSTPYRTCIEVVRKNTDWMVQWISPDQIELLNNYERERIKFDVWAANIYFVIAYRLFCHMETLLQPDESLFPDKKEEKE